MFTISILSVRYFLQPATFPASVVIVLANKGEPWLVLADRKGHAIRVDHFPAGVSWPDAAGWSDIGQALARDGRTVLVFAALADARECRRRLIDAGVRA